MKKQTRKFIAILTCFAVMLCMVLQGPFFTEVISAASQTVKIMPLGDSITDGDFWRTTLTNKLADNGYDVTFVGSNGNNEGHWGMRVCDLAAAGSLVGWLDAVDPEIVMMHFGTNDTFDDDKTTADVMAAYTTLINQMRDNNPNMIILVAKIIPLASYHTLYNERVDAINAAIDGWASEMTTEQSPITIVDQHTGFTDADIGDGVHPSASGGLKMAEKWYEALSVILDNMQGNPEVSEAPIISEEPEVSETPIVSEEPEVSEDPVVSEEPIVSEEPEVSDEPIISEEPEVTEDPIVEGDLQLITETNAWSGGYTMNVTIKNTSSSTINGWQLVLDKSEFTITNIWCAEMTETDDTYIITPMSWNADLAAGSSASFGFQATGAVPTDFSYELN